MIEIGIALKSRADVEVAYELIDCAGQIRTVDYSPYPRFCFRSVDKPALVAVLLDKTVPSDQTVERKLSTNYFLVRLGHKPRWPSLGWRRQVTYSTHVIDLPLATVSAFEIAEILTASAPHAEIVRIDNRWRLRFPLDVVRIVVDAIHRRINHAETPTSLQTAEDLLTDIENRLIRIEDLPFSTQY
ncbi:MAG: hypothetical protein HKN13_04775 [Rhodothermales bacterium]|nr:hypothetical protein [Rhodothermales bacterium]